MIFWGHKIIAIAGERSLKIPYSTKAVNSLCATNVVGEHL